MLDGSNEDMLRGRELMPQLLLAALAVGGKRWGGDGQRGLKAAGEHEDAESGADEAQTQRRLK